MAPPNGASSGAWDIPDSLRCPTRPFPSFGTSAKSYGKWFHRGSDYYDLEFLIRAGGRGITSGSGPWLILLPVVEGKRLHVVPPDFDDGDPVNSTMVGFAQVAVNGVHRGAETVHTLTTVPGEAANESKLVIARKGGLFWGGGTWVPSNVHFATHRPFKGRWVTV